MIKKTKSKIIISREAFIPLDKLYSLLERYSIAQVWFFAVLIYSLLEVVVGLTMDYLYPGGLFISIREKAEFLPSFGAYIVFMPIIWAMYRWMPKATMDVVRNVENKELIVTDDKSNPKFVTLSDLLRQVYQNKLVYILSIIGVIITSLIFFCYTIPLQTATIGLPPFWTYKPLSLIIYIIIFSISCYVLFLMFIRHFLTVLAIARFFKNTNSVKRIIPMHPDGCGGFSGFGKLTTRIVLIVVLLLIWSLGQAYFPILLGNKPIWNSLLIVYVIYFVIVPIILIASIWNPHSAMVCYKNKIIVNYSEELAVLTENSLIDIKDNNIVNLHQDIEKIKKVQELIMLIDKKITTWPISLSRLKNLGITTSVPFILSLAMNIIDIFNLVKAVQK